MTWTWLLFLALAGAARLVDDLQIDSTISRSQLERRWFAPGDHSSDIASLDARGAAPHSSQHRCDKPPVELHLTDLPYQDYFVQDCHSASQVVVISPIRDSNLSFIGPRLLVAWAPGNSGVVAFFKPSNGINGTLTMGLKEFPDNSFLRPLFKPPGKQASRNDPHVGVSGVLNLNSSAVLTLPILGSIRTIRDFTEGPSILVPEIQNAIQFEPHKEGGAILSRLWLDNLTTTDFSFTPMNGARPIKIKHRTLSFGAGDYLFEATFNYPQIDQFQASSVLNRASQDLIAKEPARMKSLAFLSYKSKLLAGAWRFLTYFGRDSMISLLLLQPILSTGEGGAIEAVISAVLERIHHNTGAVCHEETIGDYATFLNMEANETSTAPSCSYIMIDSDYYFPIVMNNYFVLTEEGRRRSNAFFEQKSTQHFGNRGFTYAHLAQKSAARIMEMAKPFAGKGNQTIAHLRHLKPEQIVGSWRDSTYGIGGGRVPYDVNTGLVPAALRAIASLAHAGYFPDFHEWVEEAPAFAQVWEDKTLQFFSVTVPQARAKALVRKYVRDSGYNGPTQTATITEDVNFHALSLDGNNGQKIVKVMNTDTAFRLFLLNTTDDTQLTSLLQGMAAQILRPFPAGLSTDVGIVIANPAFGNAPVYARNWTTAAYHGTVVWGWPMAMLAKGLEHQLGRCEATTGFVPAFCSEKSVFDNVRNAYNHLWDLIEQNRRQLSQEVWSWKYDLKTAKFKEVDLGVLSSTESDIRQLWSLTYLAVKRNLAFK